MRGADITQIDLFSYRTLEERIPANHPLRKLRLVREEWSGEKGMCRKMGRMADQRSPQAFAGTEARLFPVRSRDPPTGAIRHRQVQTPGRRRVRQYSDW